MNGRNTLLALSFGALLAGCTGLRDATPERPLFAEYQVNWTTPPEADVNVVTEELMNVVKPQPNNSLFGLRPTVALHNMIGTPRKTNGLRNLLKNKIGSAPVYLEAVPLGDVDAAFANRLNNRGYFAATARHEVQVKGRRAFVTFFVDAGAAHHLQRISYGDSLAKADTLAQHIARQMRRSPLKVGDRYDLAVLTAERQRVADALRERGYYRLNADDLVFRADTGAGARLMDLQLLVKPSTSVEARRRYTLGTVTVHGDYDPLLTPNDTVRMDSLSYVNYLNSYRPSTITRGVFLRPGQWFSVRRENNTQGYLSSFGVFKSVSVLYTDDSTRTGVLNVDVCAVPLKRWSQYYELNAITKSNNFAGPGLKVGVKDRDLFRGAEILSLDLIGRFETQVAGATRGTNAYEIGAKASLQIPRIVPFPALRTARSHVPSTRIDLSYGLFRRIGLYGLESANASYGYLWRSNGRKWHDLKVVDLSYSSLYYSSDAFNVFLDANPTIRRSFEEQFILGSSYTYTVSTRPGRKGGRLLTSLGFDLAGNSLFALRGGLGGDVPADGYRLFDRRFSQFARFRPEVRFTKPLGTGRTQLAGRVQAGVALPYGNSDVVPYVRQFFVGGPNSLRGFRARSVGPGTYQPLQAGNVLIDQTGEIKFEVNLEYRFPIAGYIKGALFADAGNVWLVNDDPQRPGGMFDIQRAGDELAVDAGFGLRFDAEVIVVRFDLATPLRSPHLPIGDRWTFDDLDPKVFNNIVFNIAIGYPF